MSRLFTLEEARATLPQVRSIVESLQHARLQLSAYAQSEPEHRVQGRTNGSSPPVGITSPEMAAEVANRMKRLLEQLDAIGCELKDLDQGLLDFRSERDGRVVYLCWRAGEDDIAYWHDLDSGFAGRQPL